MVVAVLYRSTTAKYPEAPFDARILPGRARLIFLIVAKLRIACFVDLVMGNGWHNGERIDRPHATKAERKCIMCGLRFFRHGLSSKAK